MLAQHLHDREQSRQRVPEQRAEGLGLGGVVQRLQDPLLGLGAQAAEIAQPLLLGGGAQLVQRRHAELVPDARRGLRAETRQAHEQRDVAGHNVLAFRERVDLAVLDDLHDLALDRLADPLQFLGTAVQRELGDRAARLADPRRGAAIRGHTETVGALQLHQVGQQVELRRHVGVPRQCVRHASIIRLADVHGGRRDVRPTRASGGGRGRRGFLGAVVPSMRRGHADARGAGSGVHA
jgi:hypothetical protein